jgi:hypothetical protein
MFPLSFACPSATAAKSLEYSTSKHWRLTKGKQARYAPLCTRMSNPFCAPTAGSSSPPPSRPAGHNFPFRQVDTRT